MWRIEAKTLRGEWIHCFTSYETEREDALMDAKRNLPLLPNEVREWRLERIR
jgi:hypothetical protein